MTAILKDGRKEHVFVKHAIGSLEKPLTDAQLEAKFRDLAEPVIGKETRRRSSSPRAGSWARRRTFPPSSAAARP